MKVEPIDDVFSTVDTTEEYIKDLETEIDSLKAQLKTKTKKQPQMDINCCNKYKLLLVNFHRLLDDILPF